MIRELPLGQQRDQAQARFDLVIARLQDVPRRVLAQTFADGSELAANYHSEMKRALDAWDETR
jgi:hypothetical protein